MFIKICGITCLSDALAAVEAGADLLGFNFYPKSPRYIQPQYCELICRALRQRSAPVQTVGVFVNASAGEMLSIFDQCGLDLAQLSGDEPPECLAALGGRGYKALRPADLAGLHQAVERYAPAQKAPAYLVDAHRPGLYGGTGHTADWSLARQLAAEHAILLAGGLTPENVAEAVRQVGPWGVDTASGVESAPGRKDAQRMADFVQQARNSLFRS